MRKFAREHLTYANVVSTLCLFLLLAGGTAVALKGHNSVRSNDIKNGQVKEKDLADAAVTEPKLANGAVTKSKLGPPEGWREVGPGSETEDLCADPSNVGVFCSENTDPSIPWHNFGGGFAAVAFYKDQVGIVRLKGLVQSNLNVASATTQPRTIFRLPSGYRPATSRVFSSVGRGDHPGGDLEDVDQARIDVQSDGLVVLVQDCDDTFEDCSSNGGYVTLDGISFRPDE